MKKKLIVKQHYRFGKFHKARLHLRKSYSNIFLTMTDLRNQVVICKSTGNSEIVGNKRKKKSPHSLENMVEFLKLFLKLYSIQTVQI
jgi:ribosomal protein S11